MQLPTMPRGVQNHHAIRVIVSALAASMLNLQAPGDVCQLQPEQMLFEIHNPSAIWGTAVATHNGVVAVTASGVVRIFQQQPGNGWSLIDVLTPPTPNGYFGTSLAMNDQLLLIGASAASGSPSLGLAYVFRLFGGQWRYEATLTAPDVTPLSQFGWTVALTKDLAIVGAPNAPPGTPPNGRGAVYVFRSDGQNWNFEQKLQPESFSVHQFGLSVATAGGDILAGDFPAGQVFVYGFDGTSWAQTQLITQVATAMAASGEWAAMGNPFVGSGSIYGAVAIYRKLGNEWLFHSQITAGPPDGGFGHMALAIDSNWLVVGSPEHHANSHQIGIVRGFRFDGANWVQELDIGGTPQFDPFSLQLGASVAIHLGRVVAGAPTYLVPGQIDGLVFVYPKLDDCNSTQTPDPCDAPDCNHNQVPDSCEIADHPSTDCNGNRVPDECESTLIYSVDDGSAEQASGAAATVYPGFDYISLNQFEVRPGMEVIDRLAVIWPQTVLGGFPVTLLVYRDQNNDGNPSDALLLRSVNRWINNAGNDYQHMNKFSYESIPPTYLGPQGQKFFVGVRAMCPSSTYPFAIDSNSPLQLRTWIILYSFGHSDIENPGNNGEIYSPSTSSIHGNYAIRALVTDCNLNGVWDGCDIANGTSQDLNANGIPDECEHCRADLAPPGGNGFVDLDDLLGVLSAWGMIGNTPADITADQKVDVDDLLAVLAAWGPCPG